MARFSCFFQPLIILAFISLSACSGFESPELFPENADEIVEWLFMTPEEQMRYTALKTDKEREAFIEEFWQSRNPIPLGFGNEFREEIERRVAFCNQWFGENSRSGVGWDSDRGRIYILLGPPDIMERQESAAFQQPGLRGDDLQERWVYDRYSLVLIFRKTGLFGDFRLFAPPPRLYQIADEIRRPGRLSSETIDRILELEASRQADTIRISMPISQLFFTEEEDLLHAELTLTVRPGDDKPGAEVCVIEKKVTRKTRQLLQDNHLTVSFKVDELPRNMQNRPLTIEVRDRHSNRSGIVTVFVRKKG